MSGESKFGKDEAYYILHDLKDDIRDLNNKVTESLTQAAARDQKLDDLHAKVDHLDKVIIKGNGNPSVVIQLEQLRRDISEHRIKLEHVEKNVVKPTTKENDSEHSSIRLERVKLGAKFIAFFTVVFAEAANLYQIVKTFMS